MPKKQLIYTKLPTCPHWKISRNMALIQKLSASLRCESSRMSILLKPFWQSTFSRQQDTSLIISPHKQWIEAVKWHGDTKIAAIIHSDAEMAEVKIILGKLENVVVEAESQQGVVVWSSTQKSPPSIPSNAYPLRLTVLPGRNSSGTSLRLYKWKQQDWGEGTWYILSPGTFPSALTMKVNLSTDLHWL